MKTRPGLRERKKIAAMERIQRIALDLFDAHGYDAVTVERVADEAEVSPSTIYRYFGTKEQLVLHDEYDPILIDVLETAEPGTSPLRAVREVMSEAARKLGPDEEAQVRRRMRYAYTVPAIAAAMVAEGDEAEALLRAAFARQTGRDEDEFELRVFAASVIAAFLAALRYWYERDGELTLPEAIERAMDVIQHDLEKPSPAS